SAKPVGYYQCVVKRYSAYFENTGPSRPLSIESTIFLKTLPSAVTKKVAQAFESPIQAIWVAWSPRSTGSWAFYLARQAFVGACQRSRQVSRAYPAGRLTRVTERVEALEP